MEFQEPLVTADFASLSVGDPGTFNGHSHSALILSLIHSFIHQMYQTPMLCQVPSQAEEGPETKHGHCW